MASCKSYATSVLVMMAAFAVSSPAMRAQATEPAAPVDKEQRAYLIDLNDGVSFEASPHTGLMGGSGTFGLRLSMNYSSLNLELAGEQVIGKTANLYPISVNAILNLATRGALIPYGAVGTGLLLTVPTNTLGDETVSTIGINFGGGVRYYITRTFGFRAEVKQFITSVANTRDLKDELLVFQEISLGVTFMFR